MSEELKALIARLTAADGTEALTDDEISTVREQLGARAEELADDDSDEAVAELLEIAAAVEQCDTEVSVREQARVERQAKRDEALAKIRPPQTTPTEPDKADGEGEGDGQQEPAPQAVAAAAPPRRPTAAAMQAHIPAAARPRPTVEPSNRITAALVASVDSGQWRGETFTTTERLAEALASGLNRVRPGSSGMLIASASWDYPEDRRLKAGDPTYNERLLTGMFGGPSALTASGGICTPLQVDYSVPVFSAADQPVKVSLPAFGAARGGLTFVPPPVLSSVTGGITEWTSANDASPSSPATKNVVSITCGSPTSVTVEGIAGIMKLGNMAGRFSPEQVQAWIDLLAAAHASTSELNILKAMVAASTTVNWTGAGLGAAPELLSAVGQDAENIRYQLRNFTIPINAYLPHYTRAMLRADLARRLATDVQDDNGGALAVTDAEVDNWFAVRGISVTFYQDAIPASTTVNYTYPAQTLAAPTGTGRPLGAFPAKVLALVHPANSFQFLDGGMLNLGVVRDSTLNATNDYEIFNETFEGVAFRGVLAHALIVPAVPTGGTAGTVDTHLYAGG